MKKKNISISIWILLITGFVVLIVFLTKLYSDKKCTKIEITFNNNDGKYFLTADDIQCLLNKKNNSLVGKSLSKINLSDVEKKIKELPYISDANVYSTVEGIIKINIVQRKPIARIINKYNQNYYLSDDGKLMPMSSKYVARTLIANGNITDIYSTSVTLVIDTTIKIDTIKNKTTLCKIYELAKFIDADDFWKAQICQIFVNGNGDIELLPLLGENRIIFGDIDNLKEKFENLMTFYTKELNKSGWNKYKTINIKFKNQIVCSKK